METEGNEQYEERAIRDMENQAKQAQRKTQICMITGLLGVLVLIGLVISGMAYEAVEDELTQIHHHHIDDNSP